MRALLLTISLLPSLALGQVGPRITPCTERLVGDVAVLCGAEPPPGEDAPILSRSVQHPDLARAEGYVMARLAELPGVSLATFEVTATFEVDGEQVSFAGLRTIEASLPGADPTLAPVLLGAHLDSTAKASEGWQGATDPAPGADDDASGVAALLELGRLFSAWEPGYARGLRLLFFTAEEVGLQGSFRYVEALDEEVELMVQLDPVGYNPAGVDRLWFAYDARWPELRDEADEAAQASGTWVTVQGVDAALIGGDARSDHFPFWEAGVSALHFGAFPPPPAYHTVQDRLEVVDAAFLTEVTRVVGTLVLPHLEPLQPAEEPPAACACGGASGPRGGAGWLVLLLALAPVARRAR